MPYVVVCPNETFQLGAVVQFVTCSYSGNCYLLEDIHSKERSWMMKYSVKQISEKTDRV